ncbi:O-6-methylguanine DNA methyltransferase [Rubellimicrobium thermophilum DSM 16684]|uniref:methylated-DNA--[protein]-cysteine S-methyltransferase n=1 Tax=Rubellimicrobium thermophilum DSM 16684 TaxID=1123069 RepID=S9SF48_9RHOB|nr:bifunctional helix-turn-helix domain-containing protein/methylated-DNA--[protein]-cysteine S-methyltransferase [Rubellimicrobium thermophilum]EPX84909.1 O-6-methylguanine DNA methyltransferase [Rubellimicrobium thermophilum DSM 16684]
MDQEPYHYGVVRRAIELIDAAGPRLTLPDLARAMGMGEAHLHRVFSAWAGISPKRLAQYLALGHARTLLAERRALLDVAQTVGLSGPSRLHDLFITWEAMTPGRWAAGGEGLTLREGLFESPFGPVLAMATDKGLCGLAFTAETGEAAAREDLLARWPRARIRRDEGALRPWVEAAFGRGGPAHVHAIGAPFQIKVWEALLAIPSGQVTTYGAIAGAVGRPRAVRAVGTAVGRNPVAWLIPCHRALRATGALGGYRWGLPVKRAMLAWEAAQQPECREASP